MNNHKTALVTGATSGLGFEAAAQLAEAGYGKVTISGRTQKRVEEARVRLVEKTGRDVFETIVVDLGKPRSVHEAAEMLRARGGTVDFLLLNAGMVSGNDLIKTQEGIEITVASALIGHHQLTMRMLADKLIANNARIVIASSEAARGDIPTFNPIDLGEYAAKNFGGDLSMAAESLMRAEKPVKYKPATAYANAKLYVAYWAAQLAEKLPKGTTVNAVSPGSAPDTDAGRNANFFMRYVMMPMFKLMPGMSVAPPVAAKRYLDASEFESEVTGLFFASPPKKLTGPIEPVLLPHVTDEVAAKATWSAIVSVSGGVDYPVGV